MGSGNPGLVVLRSGRDSRAISTDNSDLLSRVDLLDASGRLLSTLAALATTLLLGEEGGNPGIVDEVNGSTERSKEDQVQEDAEKC